MRIMGPHPRDSHPQVGRAGTVARRHRAGPHKTKISRLRGR